MQKSKEENIFDSRKKSKDFGVFDDKKGKNIGIDYRLQYVFCNLGSAPVMYLHVLKEISLLFSTPPIFWAV